MASLPLALIGRPVLRKKIEFVDAERIKAGELKSFVRDMIDTMRKNDGVGLAANQVGRDLRVIVLECDGSGRYPDKQGVPLQVYFNPKITSYSKEKEQDWEGCLSIPGYRGRVSRSLSVTFEALDEKGEPVKKTVHGFHARIIQHEVDHINGGFYVDRMPDLQTWMHLDELNQHLKKNIKD